MADTYIEAQYTEQMPFVGTPAQRAFVDSEAKREKISRAEVIRRALNNYIASRQEAA